MTESRLTDQLLALEGKALQVMESAYEELYRLNGGPFGAEAQRAADASCVAYGAIKKLVNAIYDAEEES